MKPKTVFLEADQIYPISEKEKMWMSHLGEVEMAVERKVEHRT